jgi:hypothetical protein
MTKLKAPHLPALAALRARRETLVHLLDAGIAEAVTHPSADHDPEYRESRQAAVAALIDYCLTSLERDDDWGPIPPALREHARRAARIGIKSHAFIRGYLAGHRRFIALLGDEIQVSSEKRCESARAYLAETYRPLLDHILDSIEHEYHTARESTVQGNDSEIREIVCRLLAGEVGGSELVALDYPIHRTWHSGVIVLGPQASWTLRSVESRLGLALLEVPWGDVIWAWLGSRRKLESEKISSWITAKGASSLSVAMGSPHAGLDGWRQTHYEARSALSLALHQTAKVTRYEDDPLVIAALENKSLATWLKAFIRPLSEHSDGGVDLLIALRAYIDAGFNYSAAEAALGHTRHTIADRVRIAEDVLGRPIRACASELSTAMRVHEIAESQPDLGIEEPVRNPRSERHG